MSIDNVVLRGNLDEIRVSCITPADINRAASLSCIYGLIDVLDYVYQQTLDIQENPWTYISEAINGGQHTVIDYLAEKGLTISSSIPKYHCSKYYVMESIKMVHSLLKSGLLHTDEHHKFIEQLLENQPYDPDSGDILKLLIEYGLDVDQWTEYFIDICKFYPMDIIDIYFKASKYPKDLITVLNNKPLYNACKCNNLPLVIYLLNNGAYNEDNMCIYFALKHGNMEMLKALYTLNIQKPKKIDIKRLMECVDFICSHE